MDVKVLKEKRAGVWEQMKTLLATVESDNEGKGRDFTAEERQSWDAMDGEINKLTEDISRGETFEERRRQMETIDDKPGLTPDSNSSRPGEQRNDQPDAYTKAFRSWLRDGVLGLEPEQRQILATGMVNAKELRAQGVATGAAGGFTVAEDFRRQIIETQKFFGSVRSVATVIETSTGAALPWPTVDDTANKGAILAENTQVTEQDVTIGQAQLDAYMYTSKLVRVSLQLLQDSAFNVEDWLSGKLAERVERILNEHFTTGTGTAQPQGIQTAATIGVTLGTGNTVLITYDGLIDLIHSVDPAYRNQGRQAGGLQFMLSDTALGTIRKLKDTTNQPLWQPSVQIGVPDTLLGYGYTVNNDMPVPAANVKSVLFGDFRAGYVIRDVRDYQLLRLEERYADFLQVGFLGFSRHDGKAQDTAAYKALRQSAT